MVKPQERDPSTESVAIVGAGIIGLCTALQLQRLGLQVSLIDPKGFGQETSGGNAGHFATEQVFPLADPSLLPQLPKMLLDSKGPFRVRPAYFFTALPWFMAFLRNMLPSRLRHNTDAIKPLNLAAIPAYQELLAELDCEDQLILQGSLLTFETTSDEKIKAQVESLRAENVSVEWLDREKSLQLEPKLSSKVKSCLFFPEVGHTASPLKLCETLGQRFLSNGGRLIQAEATGVNESASSVCIELDSSSYVGDKLDRSHGDTIKLDYDKVVIAAGAWSKSLVQKLGYKVPLDTERGYHLMLPVQQCLSRPVASAERKFIMTPMLGGLRLAGTVEFAGLQAAPDYDRATMLLPHAKALLNNDTLASVGQGEVLETWMGYRPSLPDSLPVMGSAPNHSRIYFNFGHQHLGLTWGAISGRLIAQLIDDQKPTIDMQPYSIARFN